MERTRQANNINRSVNIGALPKKKNHFFSQAFHSGSIDVVFFALVVVLLIFGLAMMYSAGYVFSQQETGDPNSYFIDQLKSVIFGTAVMIIVSKVDYTVFNSSLVQILLNSFTVLLLAATLVLNRGKAIKRWIEIGTISFQPSEVAKFVLIVTLAYIMCILYEPMRAECKTHVRPNVQRLTLPGQIFFEKITSPFMSAAVLAAVTSMYTLLVFMGSHLSGAILLFAIGVAMIWLGGGKRKYFVFVFCAVAAAVVLIYFKPEILKLFSNYAYERIEVWKTKSTVGSTTYSQTLNGLRAIGSGGLFGVGYGRSVQKMLYIPDLHTDFIFPIICEELGLVGALVVIALFALLVIRGFMIARQTNDYFGSLVVMGIMMQIAFQVILNIAVATDIIPNTGVTLPFFSYGGTSILMLTGEMGIVLSVSKKSYLGKDK